jgi:hypothetical protein
MKMQLEYSRNPFRYGADFDLDDIVGRKDEILLAEQHGMATP